MLFISFIPPDGSMVVVTPCNFLVKCMVDVHAFAWNQRPCPMTFREKGVSRDFEEQSYHGWVLWRTPVAPYLDVQVEAVAFVV